MQMHSIGPVEMFLILAGPFVGSFIGLSAIRMGQHKSVLFGRSRCQTCLHTLGFFDLIPVISFVVFGGRCRHCRNKIAVIYSALEISALLIAVVGIALAQPEYRLVTVLLGWCLLALSVFDLRAYILPDLLTIPLIATGVIFSLAFNSSNTIGHLIGAAVGYLSLAVIAIVYRMVRRRDGLGLGDAKLFCAAGSWLSWEALPIVLLLGSSSALIFAVLTRWRSVNLAAERIPFGPFLAFGFWVVWIMKYRYLLD